MYYFVSCVCISVCVGQNYGCQTMPDKLETFVGCVEKSKDILFGKFNTHITKDAKDREWEKIANTVSAVSGVSKDGEAIKKKVSTLTSQTKKKTVVVAKDQKKTGGGSASVPLLTPAETGLLGLVSKVMKYHLLSGATLSFVTCLKVNMISFIPLCANLWFDMQFDWVRFSSFLAEKKQKLQKTSIESEAQALLAIEREKLELQRERLCIERERLALERKKFEWQKVQGMCRKCCFEL
ncbi:hypothetical protein ACEWY4_010172 [Coilia grayii]|uniref:Myb/SANT-like DNA-binding domain-containing protein n=1 Tax=Coilia grayii TaxID=363190 RepID=A0ABD1K8H8_9TELE